MAKCFTYLLALPERLACMPLSNPSRLAAGGIATLSFILVFAGSNQDG